MLRLFLAFLVVCVAGCGHQGPDSSTSPGPEAAVRLETVALVAVEASREAVGTVRAKTYSVLQSKVVGHVVTVSAKEGDRVEAGQLLAALDEREAKARVQQAEDALTAARAAAKEVENSALAAQHARDAAAAGRDLAEATYKRYAELAEKKAVSKQAYDEAAARRSEAAAEAARAVEIAQSFAARGAEALARVGQAEAALEEARSALRDTQIAAPFSGVITRKAIDVGNLVSPGVTVFEMEDPTQYRLEAIVDEASIARLAPGTAVEAIVDVLGPQPLTATVAEAESAADPGSRSFLVKVDLPQDPRLRSGLYGRIRFQGERRETLTVPRSAVVTRGQLTSVLAVGRDTIARLRVVTLGRDSGDRVEVLSGLDPGERIVVDASGPVRDGSRVREGN